MPEDAIDYIGYIDAPTEEEIEEMKRRAEEEFWNSDLYNPYPGEDDLLGSFDNPFTTEDEGETYNQPWSTEYDFTDPGGRDAFTEPVDPGRDTFFGTADDPTDEYFDTFGDTAVNLPGDDADIYTTPEYKPSWFKELMNDLGLYNIAHDLGLYDLNLDAKSLFAALKGGLGGLEIAGLPGALLGLVSGGILSQIEMDDILDMFRGAGTDGADAVSPPDARGDADTTPSATDDDPGGIVFGPGNDITDPWGVDSAHLGDPTGTYFGSGILGDIPVGVTDPTDEQRGFTGDLAGGHGPPMPAADDDTAAGADQAAAGAGAIDPVGDLFAAPGRALLRERRRAKRRTGHMAMRTSRQPLGAPDLFRPSLEIGP